MGYTREDIINIQFTYNNSDNASILFYIEKKFNIKLEDKIPEYFDPRGMYINIYLKYLYDEKSNKFDKEVLHSTQFYISVKPNSNIILSLSEILSHPMFIKEDVLENIINKNNG